MYVNYIISKLAIGEVGHQLGLSSSVTGQGGPCHLTVSNDMFIGPTLAEQTEARICDAPLFQVCCEATSLGVFHLLIAIKNAARYFQVCQKSGFNILSSV